MYVCKAVSERNMQHARNRRERKKKTNWSDVTEKRLKQMNKKSAKANKLRVQVHNQESCLILKS